MPYLVWNSQRGDPVCSQEFRQLPYVSNLTLAKFSSALTAVHSFSSVIIYLSSVNSSSSTNGSSKYTAAHIDTQMPPSMYTALNSEPYPKNSTTYESDRNLFWFSFFSSLFFFFCSLSLSPLCFCLWKFPGQHFLSDSEEWPKSWDVGA